jgi:hypothetical protein
VKELTLWSVVTGTPHAASRQLNNASPEAGSGIYLVATNGGLDWLFRGKPRPDVLVDDNVFQILNSREGKGGMFEMGTDSWNHSMRGRLYQAKEIYKAATTDPKAEFLTGSSFWQEDVGEEAEGLPALSSTFFFANIIFAGQLKQSGAPRRRVVRGPCLLSEPPRQKKCNSLRRFNSFSQEIHNKTACL